MKGWGCKLEVVTPLFLAGYDQSDAELRAPTFKGLMRWWYRAARGRLGSDEALLFGSTQGGSRFRLYLGMPIYPPEYNSPQLFNKSDYLDGVQYLGFSMDRRRKFHPQDTTFDLRIIPAGLLLPREEKAILATLWLLVWFGGIGSRTRRGFGSLKVSQINPEPPGLSFQFTGQFNELGGFIENQLRTVRQWIGALEPTEDIPEFSILSARTSKVYLWREPFASWQKALDHAGQALRDFRSRKPMAEYVGIKSFVDSTTDAPDTVSRAAFGLPIQFYYTSLHRKYLEPVIAEVLLKVSELGLSAKQAEKTAKSMVALGRNTLVHKFKNNSLTDALMQKYFGMNVEAVAKKLLETTRDWATGTATGEDVNDGGHDRRGSPLLLKVLKISSTEYALLFIFIKAQILEKRPGTNEKIRIKTPRGEILVDQPSFQFVEDFLSQKLAPRSWEIKL